MLGIYTSFGFALKSFRYWEGVFPVAFLNRSLKQDLDVKPTISAIPSKLR